MTPYKLMKWGLIVLLVLLPLVWREEGQWWQHLVPLVGGYGDGAGQRYTCGPAAVATVPAAASPAWG